MIFDTISVKARWERWYRWNCDLRVINAHKKRHFLSYREHCHDTQITWPYAYYVTLGSRCKMATRAPKTKLILCLREPQGYSHISLSLWGRILKEYRNILSASKQTPCGIPWGLWSHTHWSAHYTNGRDVVQQELYKLNPLLPHCGSIARELVHCYTWGRLQIATVRGNTVGRHS